MPNPDLTLLRALAISAAGCAAGFMNSIVGSGTLISFPTLVNVGFDSIAANVANNIGLFPGSTSAAYGYRRELAGQRRRLLLLSTASATGAVIGAILLFTLSKAAFTYIVPFLILIGVMLVVLQPTIMTKVKVRQANRSAQQQPGSTQTTREVTPLLWLAVCAAGVYGGYFGAAQGVILIGIMGILLQDELVRINAAKTFFRQWSAVSPPSFSLLGAMCRGQRLGWLPLVPLLVGSSEHESVARFHRMF